MNDFEHPVYFDLSMLELFFLRTMVKNRVDDLKKIKKEHGANSIHGIRCTEMLGHYNPLYKKLDTEIERRSVKK